MLIVINFCHFRYFSFYSDCESKFMKIISLYFPPLPSLDYTNNQHKRFSDLFFSLVGWMSDGMTVMNGGW